MRAQQIMTPHVITVGPDTPVVEAVQIMLRQHISGLPVVDTAGQLIGIISEGDFIRRAEIGTGRKRSRWLAFLAGSDRIAAEFVHEHGRKVGDIMTPAPLTANEDTPLDQVVQIMETNNLKRLPIVRGKRVVGIVTRSDFVSAVADMARDVPGPSADDEQLRKAVISAIGQAVWRPHRLNVNVRGGVVKLRGVVKSDQAQRAAVVAAENVPGVREVHDHLCKPPPYPPSEEDLGGGDFVSLQQQPSTTDDEPL